MEQVGGVMVGPGVVMVMDLEMDKGQVTCHPSHTAYLGHYPAQGVVVIQDDHQPDHQPSGAQANTQVQEGETGLGIVSWAGLMGLLDQVEILDALCPSVF